MSTDKLLRWFGFTENVQLPVGYVDLHVGAAYRKKAPQLSL